jgi:protein ImuB
MIISASNVLAEKQGIHPGMVLADARALLMNLEVRDDKPDLIIRLLTKLAEWSIRFSPVVAIDPPDGLLLDASGCSHLWGGDELYLKEILKKLNDRGYEVRAGMADTIGAAWAVARFGASTSSAPHTVISPGNHIEAMMYLPPEALNLEHETCNRLHKLGLHTIRQFIKIPRASLRRRFGPGFILQLDKATGHAMDMLTPVIPPEPYHERIPCMEPIVTATGIEIALTELLTKLCLTLQQEQKGLRKAIFKGYRVDGNVEHVTIQTNRPTYHVKHIHKLFLLKTSGMEPDLGFELFTLDAPIVEEHLPNQSTMWEQSGELEDEEISELIDRIAGRIGMESIQRYLPAEHHWPERSYRSATSLAEKSVTYWKEDKPRPFQLLRKPEVIIVAAPIPDYPPLNFRHNGKLHTIIKADGPERIEQEWWLQQGQHRDYYRVEDESGNRYWIFRLGHYHDKTFQWFLHGFFA